MLRVHFMASTVIGLRTWGLFLAYAAYSCLVSCVQAQPSNFRISRNPNCSTPIDFSPDSNVLRELATALDNPNVQFLAINVKLTDENGGTYEPGACPTSQSGSAENAGVSLHWTLTRGQFGHAFAKLPVNHLTLYTLGDPFKGRRWSGTVNVTVEDVCWYALSQQERTDRMAEFIAPLFFRNQ